MTLINNLWIIELGCPLVEDHWECDVRNILTLLAGISCMRIPEILVEKTLVEEYEKRNGYLVFREDRAKF